MTQQAQDKPQTGDLCRAKSVDCGQFTILSYEPALMFYHVIGENDIKFHVPESEAVIIKKAGEK